MPILNLKMDNILSFNQFEINFSYPQKLNHSLVNNEFLSQIPSFRYKKINIFIGSNASGKTSLIQCIWKILLFLQRKERIIIENLIHSPNKEANIELDFADNQFLYRIKVKTINNNSHIDIRASYNAIKLTKRSSYEILSKELDSLEYIFKDYLEILNNLNMNLGWMIVLPATENIFDRITCLDLNEKEENDFINILNRVLHTLDPSISSVIKSRDADNAYVITHDEIGKIIIQDGMSLKELDKLSSGTKYGFNIAKIVFSIKNKKNGIYLIDEQFSYVNSNIEKAFISLMVSLLGDDEQIFITTHNPEVLDLKLPFHSYNFIKKEKIDGASFITTYCASEFENRNNVSAKTILDNDVFNINPDIIPILEIGEKYA
jgi:AAA15 family ATPase/GTPase